MDVFCRFDLFVQSLTSKAFFFIDLLRRAVERRYFFFIRFKANVLRLQFLDNLE